MGTATAKASGLPDVLTASQLLSWARELVAVDPFGSRPSKEALRRPPSRAGAVGKQTELLPPVTSLPKRRSVQKSEVTAVATQDGQEEGPKPMVCRTTGVQSRRVAPSAHTAHGGVKPTDQPKSMPLSRTTL